MKTQADLSPVRPDVLLRLEGLAALIAAFLAYQVLFPGHWVFFALMLFVPDVSLLGYARSNGRLSAALYNLFHNYVLAAILALLAWQSRSDLAGKLALIWLAHISLDRTVGYGLKFPGSFRFTHIQSAAVPGLEQ